MSIQFQASTKSKREKLDFIKDNFSQAAVKDGEVELLKLGDNEAVYRSGGFTQFGRLEKTQKGSDIFISDCDIGNLDEAKIDRVYDEVLHKSKGKEANPFLPVLDDLDNDKGEDEEFLEPFHLIK